MGRPRTGRITTPATSRPGGLALGRHGEELACDHLRRLGYEIVARGFRLFRGEIDVIARDGPTLVFVEVKARADEAFGRPEESVTPGKQRQVRRIAQGYLHMTGEPADTPCRFDVISILVPEDGSEMRLEHFRDAF